MSSHGKHSADRQEDGASDRRWVVVSEDGRFSTLGRASDPTDLQIEAAAEALREQGLAGWLAVMSGSPYGKRVPTLMEVRPLASPTRPWPDAAAACLAAIAARRGDIED
jgi:hypothetical protein